MIVLAIVHALRRGEQWPPAGHGGDPSVNWLAAVAQWHFGLTASCPLGMVPFSHDCSSSESQPPADANNVEGAEVVEVPAGATLVQEALVQWKHHTAHAHNPN